MSLWCVAMHRASTTTYHFVTSYGMPMISATSPTLSGHTGRIVCGPAALRTELGFQTDLDMQLGLFYVGWERRCDICRNLLEAVFL